jgi:hypothetical protein
VLYQAQQFIGILGPGAHQGVGPGTRPLFMKIVFETFWKNDKYPKIK